MKILFLKVSRHKVTIEMPDWSLQRRKFDVQMALQNEKETLDESRRQETVKLVICISQFVILIFKVIMLLFYSN